MSSANVTSFDKSDLNGLRFLGEGGQAKVYDAPNVRIHNTAGTVLKLYHTDKLQDLDSKALQAMVEFRRTLSIDEGTRLFQLAAWPAFTVTDTKSVVGFLMPKIPREFQHVSALSGELTPSEIHHLLNSEDNLANKGIGLSDEKRFHLICEVAEALMFFHSYDIFVGDFSGTNLLFNIDQKPRVYFIDCDSMRFRGVSVLPQGRSNFWTIPDQNEQMATRASDTYKFGLFALRLFTGEQDSRSPKLLPKSVPSKLKHLIAATLNATAPGNRPPLAEWPDVAKRAAKRASRRPAQKKRKAPPRRQVGRSSTPSLVRKPHRPTPVRRTTRKLSFRNSSFSTKLTLVLGAIIGFVVAGFIAGIASYIVAAIPVWIYTLIASSGPSFDTIQGFIVLIAGIAGGVFGAVLGVDTAVSSPRFVQIATGIVVGIVALSMYVSYWDNQRDALAANFQLVDASVSENITADGELIAQSLVILGPRQGLGLSAAFDHAVPGETELVFNLYKERRGRYNLVHRCAGTVNKAKDRSWCAMSEISNKEFGVGSYVLVVEATTYDVTKAQRTEFVIRSAQGALIARVQGRLAELGYGVGKIDGISGRKTIAAIKEFQRDYGMPIDGKLSDRLVSALDARGQANSTERNSKNDTIASSKPYEQTQPIVARPTANDPASEAVDSSFRIDNSVVAESIDTTRYVPVSPATEFAAPRTGIAYWAAYSGAIPNKTYFSAFLMRQEAGRSNLVTHCRPWKTSLARGTYWCQRPETQLTAGRYEFKVTVIVDGLEKTFHEWFIVRDARKDLVSAIQEILNDRGYGVGLVDGISGPRTEAAIRRFQRDNRLTPTGQITEGLLLSLSSLPASSTSARVRLATPVVDLATQASGSTSSSVATGLSADVARAKLDESHGFPPMSNEVGGSRTRSPLIDSITSYSGNQNAAPRRVDLTAVNISGVLPNEAIAFQAISQIQMKQATSSERLSRDWYIAIIGPDQSGAGSYLRRIECGDRLKECQLFYAKFYSVLTAWRGEHAGRKAR